MRCIRCIMLSDVPGSDFDETGVCTWCRSGFPNYRPLGIDVLGARLKAGLRPESAVDCIVGVSGGKDSSFALWAMKYYFGLRVEAFTYDHAGVSARARKNVQALCDTMEVPLTVCALPKNEHCESFRDYFKAFIDRPSTVTAGLSCVACKHLHIFGTELAIQRKAPFVVWAKCPLEDSPFLALKPAENSTSREGLLKGGVMLSGEVLRSATLLQAILVHFRTTAKGCLAFSPTSSFMKIRYPSVQQIPFFEYWRWNPQEIYSTLTQVGWRKPSDVPSDWHSDCDFHVIKEYMFQKILGVSYTDGFLSNQIRAGIITRSDALKQLLIGQRHFAAALPGVLAKYNLPAYAPHIDTSCFFTVENGESQPRESLLVPLEESVRAAGVR